MELPPGADTPDQLTQEDEQVGCSVELPPGADTPDQLIQEDEQVGVVVWSCHLMPTFLIS